MTVILYLFWLAYGGDIERLGNPDYYVRSVAYNKLKDAGLWCVPALLEGQKSGNMERRLRIELLLDRQGKIADRIIKQLLTNPLLTESDLANIARVMTQDSDFADHVFFAVDVSGGFHSRSSRSWAEAQPYAKQTLQGDIAYMLQMTRQRLMPPPTQPQTMTLPGCWDEDE